ncbi:uncharacterized protein A4U43_C01F30440 [Asparagus officinalis]|uniref:Phospholipid/glycerol acyltransferase domain-containing protein n=1 Tax=Asparagus officinalis TaxID=4686 RepID=A0A5P1FV50_ASPOF|nr:uncharacterized protein A4U43_C01F30440 [Asparagus officinalis]
MVFPVLYPKIVMDWLLSRNNTPAKRMKRQGSFHRTASRSHLAPSPYPSVAKCSPEGRESQSFVCDFQTALLRSQSLFPYFMLVAFEGGSLLRALLLLLAYPLILVLGPDEGISIKIMVFISFCGLRVKDAEIVSRAVLPKFYLENMNVYSYEVLASTKKRVVVSRMPRVMIGAFLEEYLGVGEVVGAELQEPYIVTKEASGPSSVMPRSKYPKPLIFHDGRLAFLPTPLSSLFLFLYLPFGLTLAIARVLIGTILPYNLAIALGPFSGFKLHVHNPPTKNPNPNPKGVLYVCNHRTLLDPLMLTAALGRPLTAVTYSLSPVSEILSPIRTVRLTRNRAVDARKLQKLLSEGDVVICPEGTTCREPYLLRFSALFAELTDNMVPCAVDARISMFYGTTASGFKWLDPIFFLMNPRPVYEIRFLGLLPKEMSCGGGLKGVDVANGIQRMLGEELGFECTSLTRKDKYLMLAGNEGIVDERRNKRH